jgi:molecular chaperone GrpE
MSIPETNGTGGTGGATPETEPSTEASAVPQTPEELMQAASARIAALEGERDDFRDRWMRAEAETANVRARGRREVEETRQFAVQKFARDIAEAAETLRRGLDSIPSGTGGEGELVARLREGFEAVERSLLAALERNGVRREDPTGAVFDPNLHQAMAEQETTDHPPGTVIQAWTPAWTLNGRLLRPAMVVVAKVPQGAGTGPAAHIDTTA